MANAALDISRLCTKPNVFSGDKDKWRDFELDMTNFMAANDENCLNDLRTAGSMNEEVEDNNGDPALRHRRVVLYSVLRSYLSGDAKSLAESYEDSHNGFELLRILQKEMEPNSGMRQLALGRKIGEADILRNKADEQFAPALRLWAKDIEAYNKIPGITGQVARYDEHMQMGTLLENAPAGPRAHLQTSAALRSCADLRGRIETYLLAKGAWNLGDGATLATPMEVDGAFKGNGKGKGDGGCFRCGDKGHRAAECPKKAVICNKCGKTGHIARMCMTQGSGGKGKGDGGKLSGGKGKYGDGKGGHANGGNKGWKDGGYKRGWRRGGGKSQWSSGGKGSWVNRSSGENGSREKGNCYVCGCTEHLAHQCSRRWQPMQVGNVSGDPWCQPQFDPWGQASTVAPQDSASQVGIRPQQQQGAQQPLQQRGDHGTGSVATTAQAWTGKGAGQRQGIGGIHAVVRQTTEEMHAQEWVLSMVEQDADVEDINAADEQSRTTVLKSPAVFSEIF